MKKSLIISSLIIGSLFNAQLTEINENFETFPLDHSSGYGGAYGNLPYNDWTSSHQYPYIFTTSHSQTGNKYLKGYSLFNPNAQIFIFTPELVSTHGELSFYAGTSGGSLEVGYISDKSDASTFTVVESIALEDALKKYQITIPENDSKYISFKYIASGIHKVFGLDNVKFTPSNLGTIEIDTNQVKSFVIDEKNEKIVFIGKQKPAHIKVYNAAGNLILNEKVKKNEVAISNLKKGIYFFSLENENNKIESGKFLKK